MSSRKQAEEVLKRLPSGYVIGAEIGVAAGKMSAALLERPDLGLYMVDSWLPMPKYRVDTEEQERRYRRAVEVAGDRAHILKMDSSEAAKLIPDGTLDFVFIDADHSYEGVRRDILTWTPKLKPNGLMGGHDYNNPGEKCGREVKRAVDELGKPTLGEDTTWFY